MVLDALVFLLDDDSCFLICSRPFRVLSLELEQETNLFVALMRFLSNFHIFSSVRGMAISQQGWWYTIQEVFQEFCYLD